MGINFARAKRRPSALKVPLCRFKTSNSSPRTAASPTAAPFNSTSFLIRQKSRHRDEEDDSPAALEQYGSNMMIAMDQSQARTMSSPDDSSLLNLQLQLQGLQIADRAEATTQILLHQSSCIGSASSMDLDEEGHDYQAFHHRRIRSVTDDNFDLLFQSNANCELHDYRF